MIIHLVALNYVDGPISINIHDNYVTFEWQFLVKSSSLLFVTTKYTIL